MLLKCYLDCPDYKNFASNIKLGLDVKGGVYAVFAVDKQDFIDNKYEGDKSKTTEVDYDIFIIIGKVKYY